MRPALRIEGLQEPQPQDKDHPMSQKPISDLRRRMLEDMAVRRFGEKTQHDYIRHIETFAIFLGVRFMSWEELDRLSGILRRAEEAEGKIANEQDASDFEKIACAAHDRRLAGWKPEDAWQLGGKNRWGLIFALRARHPGKFFTSLSDEEFLDTLDLTAEEFEQLIALVKRAETLEDILPFKDVIGRLRVKSHRLDVSTFGDLVLKGRHTARCASRLT
jgi:hypothetical protein